MTAQKLLLCILGVTGVASLPLEAEEAPPFQLAVHWTDQVTTPAICIGKPTWFVSVIPESIGAEEVKAPLLRTDEKEHPSRVLYVDPDQRLCLIESVETADTVKPVHLASGASVLPGNLLHCQLGAKGCRTIIAGKESTYQGQTLSMPLLRVRLEDETSFCHPGMPLYNEEGELAGILTGRLLATPREAHAVPASQLRKLVGEFERFQRSGNVRIGILFHEETRTPEVLEVRPGSPAEKGGIEVGDIILRVNGRDVETLDELADFCAELTAGHRTRITVLRGLEKRELEIVPEFRERP